MLKVRTGDCLDIMESYIERGKKVHAVITDPPYDYDIIGKDWNQTELDRRIAHAKKQGYGVPNLPYGNARRSGSKTEQWFEKERINIKEYFSWTQTWARLTYELLHFGGFILVCINNTSAATVQRALESVGFYTKDVFVLLKSSNIRKGTSLHRSKLRRGENVVDTDKQFGTVVNNLTEFAVLAHKPFEPGITTYLDQLYSTGVGYIDCNALPSNVLTGFKEKVRPEFYHVNRKPLCHFLSFVGGLTYQNQFVLDPFCGSGTTGVACKMLGRNFIGIEKEHKTSLLAQKRIDSTARPLFS